MKKFLILLIMALAFPIAQKGNAQDETRIKEIAFNYVLQNIESISSRPWKIKESSCQKFSNGNYFVKVALSRTLTEVSQGLVPNQVHAYGATFNVGVREGTIRKDYEDEKNYLVFVNGNGVVNTFVYIPKFCEEHKLSNSIIVLPQYSFGSYKYVYRKIACYSDKGEMKWEYDNTNDRNYIIWDFAFTNNNMYVVGGREQGCYKVFSLSNGEVLYESQTKTSVETRYTKISLKANGLHVTESPKDSPTKTHIFPYLASDNSFQEGLVLKEYNRNNASDQVAIGTKYFYGDGIKRDYTKAVEWFKKAANQNNSRGLYCLGYCYQNGNGVNQDKTEAASLYEKASNLGDRNAMEALSKMYINGDGVPKDLNRGLHLQEILAFDGDKEAQKIVMSNQSVQYEKANISASEARNIALNSHSQKDYMWAEFCIKRAIELGNNDARLDYGLWLGKGDGLLKDYAKAEEYLTPFAENGIKDAASMLGMIYRNLNDKKKEMYWVEKAALNGDVDSQLKMAEAYLNGIGVKKDKKAAAAMYERAAEKGNVGALIKTVYAYAYGKGVKKNLNTADKYFRMLPHQIAFEIANSIFWGHDVKKDKNLGLAFYLHAGQMGNQEAMKEYEFWSKQMKTIIGW